MSQEAIVGLVFAAILAVDLLLLAVWSFRRYALNLPTFAPRWSLLDIWNVAHQIAVVLFFLLAPLFFILAAASDEKAMRQMSMSDPNVLRILVLPGAVLQNVAFFAVPALFMLAKYGLPLRRIGLPPLPRRKDIAAGVALGVLALLAFGLMETGLRVIAGQFRHIEWVKDALQYEKTNPVAGMMKALPTLGPGWLLLAVAGVGLAAPLGEEMLFRGFVFNVLKHRFARRVWGMAVALVVSSALFTAGHTYALGLLPVFLFGLLLAWVYHNTGSLWTVIIIHATNNTISVLAAFFFPSLLANQ